MRLQVMSADRYAAYFICLGCSKRMVLSKEAPPIYADLDGAPYVAYYCPECAAKLLDRPNA